MSLFSFLKKNKENYSLIINIDSGKLSGGIAKFTEESGVELTHFHSEKIPFQTDISIDRHLELMQSSLEKLVNSLRNEKFKQLDRIFYVFSSPWSISQTKTIRLKEAKEFSITDEHLNNLINEQEKQFKKEIGQSGKIIEKKIIQIKINGYIVSNIKNKKASELEVSVLFTIVPENILNIVDKAVSKIVAVKNIWCHSSALAVFSTIRNLFPQKEDFIYINLSDEITDISIIRNEIIINNISIPFGRSHFIRELSLNQKVTEEVADSMIWLHCNKKNDELASLKLKVAMDASAKKWLDNIFTVLDNLKERIYVPESVFMLIDRDLSCFLKEKLEKHDFQVKLIDNRQIKPSSSSYDIQFKIVLKFLDNLYKI